MQRGYIHHSLKQRILFAAGGFAEERAAKVQRRGAERV